MSDNKRLGKAEFTSSFEETALVMYAMFARQKYSKPSGVHGVLPNIYVFR